MNGKKIGLYVLLACLMSWALAGGFHAAGGRWGTNAAMAVGVFYMIMPALAAMIVQTAFREPIREPLGFRFRPDRWWVVAWLLPLLLALLAIPIALAFPGVAFSPDLAGLADRMRQIVPPDQATRVDEMLRRMPAHPFWIFLAQGLFAGPTINALAALGEELGWRGFLQRELAPLGFWRSSAAIGFVWGFWHAPLILMGHNYPQHPVAGVAMMIVFCVLLAPLVGYVRLRARSVFAAAIYHGSLNATAGLAVILLHGENDLVAGMTGLAGFIVLAIANVILATVIARRGEDPVASAYKEPVTAAAPSASG